MTHDTLSATPLTGPSLDTPEVAALRTHLEANNGIKDRP